MSAREWDAATYDEVAAPVQGWGFALVDRLELRGDEAVLDAGCGSGAVTEALVARLPRGRVIAVDGSADMVARARERLAGEPRAEVRVADLLELALEEPVDVVFSNAVFHWIGDHPRLFAHLHAALRPGGRLIAQMGGSGNAAAVQEVVSVAAREPPFAEHLAGWRGPWNFRDPAGARRDLEAAGFADVEAGLHEQPVSVADPPAFLRTMVLGSHLDRLPEQLRAAFVERVVGQLESPLTVRYVRLTLSARRPARGSSA